MARERKSPEGGGGREELSSQRSTAPVAGVPAAPPSAEKVVAGLGGEGGGRPPSGLRQLTPEELALSDGWERRDTDDGVFWINRRDFNVPGGVVPQGVFRSTEEAYALEVRRLG